MAVKIVTDSTADIPAEVASELGICVVPLEVHFGNQVYRDGVDLSPSEFYEKLAASKRLPTTSTVSPGQFAHVYDTLAEETDEVLAIVISGGLSATYESAVQGRELRIAKDCRVEVIDSRLVVMALGLVAMEAAREAQKGASLDQVVTAARRAVSKVRLRMAFDTLEYARRGGRIGAAKAFLGTLLNLKPILTLKDGVVAPVARVRTRAKAIEHLRRFAAESSNIKEIAVEHTTTPDEAKTLAESLTPQSPQGRIIISTIGSVMGTHLGPGALGVAVLQGD